MKKVLNPNYPTLQAFVDNIEVHFDASSDVLYDARNQIKVVRYDNEDFVVKAFRIPNLINRFVYRFLRPSKAKRSYQYAFKIGSDHCTEPIAYLEEHRGILMGKSYFISKRYNYDFTIRPILLDDNFDETLRKEVLIAFADFTLELHEHGILHQDYSYGNILIKKKQGGFGLNVIDINRMKFKVLTMDERLENFARLSAKDEYMKIIIDQYAMRIDKPADELLETALNYRDIFIKKRQWKNKLRGR